MTHKPRPTALAVSLLATAFAAPAGAALANHGGGTQIAEHRGHRFMHGPQCRFRGVRISQRFVRIRARAAGFRRIHDIRFVPRRYGRQNWCGFYRAKAMLRGRPYVIFADSHSGRVVGRQPRGTIGRSHRQDLSAAQVRSILRRHGYRHIRNVRYVRRGGRDFYVARAHWRGWMMRLRVDDESGRITNRRRLWRLSQTMKSPDLTQREVRALLRAKGYRRIRDVRYRKTAPATGYLAIAHYDKVAYRLSVSGTSGKIEAKRRLR